MRKRTAYIENVNAEIDKWNSELDQLASTFKDTGVEAGAQHDHDERMKAIRCRRDAAMAKLMRIESAHDDPRDYVKQGIAYLWSVLKTGFGKIASRLK